MMQDCRLKQGKKGDERPATSDSSLSEETKGVGWFDLEQSRQEPCAVFCYQQLQIAYRLACLQILKPGREARKA